MVKSINTDSSIYIHPLLYLVKYPLVSCNLTKCFWYPSTSFWQYSGWIFNHFSWQNWWSSFKLVSFLAQTWLFSRVEVWTLGSPFQKPSGPFLNNCTFRCHQFKELFECVTTLPWSARRPKLSPSDDRKLVRVFRNHQGCHEVESAGKQYFPASLSTVKPVLHHCGPRGFQPRNFKWHL